ncbi:PAS domain-containing protein [Rubrivirga marina]|uniref:histidine kinase n=1 Tax=Rubrivirga marina TaxID=1196024 RepID=A0A271J0A3_9BACT|nr:PAS domain-containing protein [Rubrivirga marina]PAP76668.1 hypothetical protein BSZ37_09545 [Rubrivirga marina]
MPAALLFAADAGGALHVVAAVGTWGGDAVALRALAETLGGDGVDVLDVAGAIEGARFAAGARLGDGEGVLLVLAPDDRVPDEAWTEAFATSVQLALGLVRSVPSRLVPGRLLHEVAVHPGTFEDRLDLALQRAAETLGLDGAAFALVEDGQWAPHTVFDPAGALVPIRPVPAESTFCAVTARTDGPFAVEDAAAAPLGIDTPAAYLGAPVFVGGRCVGTFSVVGRTPRPKPFSDDDRALVESLARWVGSSLNGVMTARRLADREADLAAFFDGAPMGMGVTRLLDGDLLFVRVNAVAAAALGSTPDAIAGRLASELGLGGRLGRDLARRWLDASRAALAEGTPQAFDAEVETDRGLRTLAATVSPIVDVEGDARCAFVVEDVSRRRAAERAPTSDSPVEALLALAPLALFATDSKGRLVLSRGRALDLLGLDAETSAGRPLADLFADAPGAASGIAAALAGGDATWTADVGDRTFEVRILARSGRGGRPQGLVGVALDVTNRTGGPPDSSEARRELLKHLDREIRSPLTSILGYADLIGADASAEDLCEVRGVIERAGDRLMAALDELALLGGDAVVAQPTPTDVCAVVTRVAEESRPAAEARRIAMNVWCTLPEAPLLVDAALFEKLVRHLVSGAVAAADGPRVDVEVRAFGPEAFEFSVTGGVPTDALGLRAGYVPRLAEALGGTAHRIEGARPGWALHLPRQPVPFVEIPEPWSADGTPGEAPAMALVDPAA